MNFCFLKTRPFALPLSIAPLGAILIGVIVLILSSDAANAQSKKKLKLYPGDIVEYNDTRSGRTFGLILSLKPKVNIERIDDDGKIIEGSPSRSTPDVKVIDSLRTGAERPRTWKSADGEFELRAILLGFDNDNVRLKKEDGKTMSVPKSSLSEKDQGYLGRSDLEQSANPFDVDESKQYPEAVMKLIVRRKSIMGFEQRHTTLKRLNRGPLIGDIIKYKSREGTMNFGIIAALDRDGTIEKVGENNKIEEERSDLEDVAWWFYDREVRPIVSRPWQSVKGKFSIEAKLIGIDGDTLELQKLNGDVLKVPLSKLSGNAQDYVEKVRDRFETDESEIVAERSSYSPELKLLLERRVELIDRLRRYQIAAKDVAKIKEINLSLKPLGLSTEQLRPENLDGQSFSVTVGIATFRSATITEISYSKKSGSVAFTIPARDARPKLAVVDVNSGKISMNSRKDEIGEDGVVLSISPSGETILLISDDERGEQQLEVWKNFNGVLTRFASVPYESYRTPHAHLFADGHGVILNAKGGLVFFDLTDRITPTHIVNGSGNRWDGGRFQISDDQQSVFFFPSDGRKLFVLDVVSKRCVGGVALGESKRSNVAVSQVSADGESVTHIDGSRLAFIDIKSGKVIKENTLKTSVDQSTWGRGFPVLSPSLIRLYNGSLYNLDLGVSIGTIDGGNSQSKYFSNTSRIQVKIEREPTPKAAGGFQLGTMEREEASQLTLKAETLDLDQLVNFSDSLTEEDVVVFGEGKQLALDIDVGAGSEDALVSKLTSLMTEAGVEIVDESDYVMKLRFTTEKPVTETFEIVEMINPYSFVPHRYNTRRTGQKRTVTITPKTSSAVLTFEGEKLWAVGDSVRLGYPGSVERLNEIVQKASSMSPRSMLDFVYPTSLKKLLPSKMRTFEWR